MLGVLPAGLEGGNVSDSLEASTCRCFLGFGLGVASGNWGVSCTVGIAVLASTVTATEDDDGLAGVGGPRFLLLTLLAGVALIVVCDL